MQHAVLGPLCHGVDMGGHGLGGGCGWAWRAPLASPHHTGVGLGPVCPFPPILMGKVSLAASCAGPSFTNSLLSSIVHSFPPLPPPPLLKAKCRQSRHGLRGITTDPAFLLFPLARIAHRTTSFSSIPGSPLASHHRRLVVPLDKLLDQQSSQEDVGVDPSLCARLSVAIRALAPEIILTVFYLINIANRYPLRNKLVAT